jgi:hypothetical protein
MHEILPQTFASSADSAVRTVVNWLCAVVVPQLANVAVIATALCQAIAAALCRLLWRPTHHTKHVLCAPPVQLMVLSSVVAMSASVPTAAVIALHLDVALVMLAPELGFHVGSIVVSCCLVCRIVLRSVRRGGVSRTQVVWVLRVDVGRG